MRIDRRLYWLSWQTIFTCYVLFFTYLFLTYKTMLHYWHFRILCKFIFQKEIYYCKVFRISLYHILVVYNTSICIWGMELTIIEGLLHHNYENFWRIRYITTFFFYLSTQGNNAYLASLFFFLLKKFGKPKASEIRILFRFCLVFEFYLG